MKSKIMKRAWEIKKAAAIEIGCKVSDVCFSICLKLAWKENRGMQGTEKQVAWANDIKAKFLESMSTHKEWAVDINNIYSLKAFIASANKAGINLEELKADLKGKKEEEIYRTVTNFTTENIGAWVEAVASNQSAKFWIENRQVLNHREFISNLHAVIA